MGRPVAYIVVISYLAQDQLNDYMTYPDLQLTEVLTTIFLHSPGQQNAARRGSQDWDFGFHRNLHGQPVRWRRVESNPGRLLFSHRSSSRRGRILRNLH